MISSTIPEKLTSCAHKVKSLHCNLHHHSVELWQNTQLPGQSHRRKSKTCTKYHKNGDNSTLYSLKQIHKEDSIVYICNLHTMIFTIIVRDCSEKGRLTKT